MSDWFCCFFSLLLFNIDCYSCATNFVFLFQIFSHFCISQQQCIAMVYTSIFRPCYNNENVMGLLHQAWFCIPANIHLRNQRTSNASNLHREGWTTDLKKQSSCKSHNWAFQKHQGNLLLSHTPPHTLNFCSDRSLYPGDLGIMLLKDQLSSI